MKEQKNTLLPGITLRDEVKLLNMISEMRSRSGFVIILFKETFKILVPQVSTVVAPTILKERTRFPTGASIKNYYAWIVQLAELAETVAITVELTSILKSFPKGFDTAGNH